MRRLCFCFCACAGACAGWCLCWWRRPRILQAQLRHRNNSLQMNASASYSRGRRLPRFRTRLQPETAAWGQDLGGGGSSSFKVGKNAKSFRGRLKGVPFSSGTHRGRHLFFLKTDSQSVGTPSVPSSKVLNRLRRWRRAAVTSLMAPPWSPTSR